MLTEGATVKLADGHTPHLRTAPSSVNGRHLLLLRVFHNPWLGGLSCLIIPALLVVDWLIGSLSVIPEVQGQKGTATPIRCFSASTPEGVKVSVTMRREIIIERCNLKHEEVDALNSMRTEERDREIVKMDCREKVRSGVRIMADLIQLQRC
jgi:hypothetical protein